MKRVGRDHCQGNMEPMLKQLKRTLKSAVLREFHRRNELLRERLGQVDGISPAAWGASRNGAGELVIGDCGVAALAREFGTPLYIVDKARLKADYDNFIGSFRNIYPRVEVGYSYKTNPLPGVLAELHRFGALAEVISHFELWLALRLGVPPGRILFNGPGKTSEAIELAVREGVSLINIDSLAEIDDIANAAVRWSRQQVVGVRIVTSVGWSAQFGLSLQSGDAFEAFRRIATHPNLTASGLHFHLGTGIREAPIYLKAVREMLDFAQRLKSELKIEIMHFDLGGGFGVPTVRPMSIWDQRLMANGMPPGPVDTDAAARPRDYSQRIIELVRQYYPVEDASLPTIYFEPGRALSSQAQCLILKVLAIKTSGGGRPKVILDGGKNIAMPTGYELHELLPVNIATDLRLQTDFFGPLCHPGDQLYVAKPFPQLTPGDLVAVMDAGAYFVPNQMNFSHARPAAIMIAEGRPHVLRDRESFGDVVRLDRLDTTDALLAA